MSAPTFLRIDSVFSWSIGSRIMMHGGRAAAASPSAACPHSAAAPHRTRRRPSRCRGRRGRPRTAPAARAASCAPASPSQVCRRTTRRTWRRAAARLDVRDAGRERARRASRTPRPASREIQFDGQKCRRLADRDAGDDGAAALEGARVRRQVVGEVGARERMSSSRSQTPRWWSSTIRRKWCWCVCFGWKPGCSCERYSVSLIPSSAAARTGAQSDI